MASATFTYAEFVQSLCDLRKHYTSHKFWTLPEEVRNRAVGALFFVYLCTPMTADERELAVIAIQSHLYEMAWREVALMFKP